MNYIKCSNYNLRAKFEEDRIFSAAGNPRKQWHMYFAYVQSHFTYMMPIYAECSMKKLKELQTVENSCVKAMYRLPQLTSTTFIYSISILPIATVERVTNIWKMSKSLTKHNFTIVQNTALHAYNTRTRNRIHSFNPHVSIRNSTI